MKQKIKSWDELKYHLTSIPKEEIEAIEKIAKKDNKNGISLEDGLAKLDEELSMKRKSILDSFGVVKSDKPVPSNEEIHKIAAEVAVEKYRKHLES